MIGLDSYFSETSRLLRSISFHHMAGRYEGRGRLSWSAEKGILIEGFLTRHGPPVPNKVEIGKVGVIAPEHMQSIRMRPDGFRWAITRRLPFVDRLDVLAQDHLSLTTDRVVFCSASRESVGDRLLGRALLVVDELPLFRNPVITETRINDTVLTQLMTHGIDEKDENVHVVGIRGPHSTVELSYSMDHTATNKVRAWRWPLAARDALSVLTGQRVVLLAREVRRGTRRIIEMRKQEAVRKLDLLAPLGRQVPVNHTAFLKLANFFVSDASEVSVCRAMFGQLVEASGQGNWQVRELLVATILEAALRTFEGKPIAANDKSWNVEGAIKRFRERYWSREWNPSRKKAIDCFSHLRHRNAHPDWLTTHSGAESADKMAEALDDMIYLARFYGYMMLALAGFKNVERRFPGPHREWNPLLTMTQGLGSQQTQDAGSSPGGTEDQNKAIGESQKAGDESA